MRYPKVGDHVKVIQKIHYPTGELTEGIVKEILTMEHNHPRGTKVRLSNGIVGRIQEFCDTGEKQPPKTFSNDRRPRERQPRIEEKPFDQSYFDDKDALV